MVSDVNVGHVRTVLARWFPDQEITIERAGEGVSTPVFRAEIGPDLFWVRLGEVSGERRDGEVAAHQRLVAAGISVPKIVRYEAVPDGLDRSIALTTHILGIPLIHLAPDLWTEAIALDVGRVLARINGMQVRGFGWAYGKSEHTISVGEHASRSAWTRDYRDASRAIRERGVFDASTAVALNDTIERWANLPDGGHALLAHGDFDVTHVYVDPDCRSVTGVIDFGELRGADPLYDLGHLLLHDGESGRPNLFPAVIRGYSEITPLPDDAMVRIRTQALAIGARALAIQLARPHSPYRDWLIARMGHMMTGERWD